ncbi:30S ribosomal protein S27ae [Candidatus Woesearchaeota archaeon]|jgi:ubiquitin-small subunit ribosomal protein S27Ae|nr:30S ribosomal protein S27ae [Candidatus Woesearchaeota archaeon]MBT6519191.1 30S ribosomal protein S27ae [Candidatus Woesearchaeota archaeon]MBT7367651.1 30S ribosomal protein S27ae [Candidatus Woesearchaeota archaeon]
MAKKQKKTKPTAQKYKNYEVSGDTLTRKNSVCPKCGGGVFMAKHKDRNFCGKCQYTEFTNKKKEE